MPFYQWKYIGKNFQLVSGLVDQRKKNSVSFRTGWSKVEIFRKIIRLVSGLVDQKWGWSKVEIFKKKIQLVSGLVDQKWKYSGKLYSATNFKIKYINVLHKKL